MIRSSCACPVTRDITTDVPALVSPQFLWQLRLREWFVLSGVPRAVKILQSLFGDEYVEENTASDSSGLHSPLINAELPPDCEDPWGQLWLSDAQLIDDIDAMEDGTLVNETWSTARRELSELCVGAAPRSTSPRLRIPSTVVTSKGSIFSCYGLRNADDYERWFVAQRSLAERIGAGWAHDDAGEHAQMIWSNVAFHKLLDVYAEAEKHFIGSGEKL